MKYPSITYRVQLHKDFTFAHLKNILPYLHRLGISTIYASPITKARAGSSHGYDVVDSQVINPEIGTLDELQDIAQQLKQYDMNWIQDIVPNHMAFHTDNWRLNDVLQRGINSTYYNFFDINWASNKNEEVDKVLVPVLGKSIEEIINNNELLLQWSDSGIQLCYAEKQYPVSVTTYQLIVNQCAENLHSFLQQVTLAENSHYEEWQSAKRQFVQQINANPELARQLQACLGYINNDKQLLEKIVHSQHYQLAVWNDCNTQINYRRFFAVNELISLRMDEQNVFDEYHTLIQQLCKQDLIQGVRVDHIDGLHNPRQYIQKLRALLGEACYIIVEKILEYNEELGQDWDMQGTSGYEFLAFTNQLFTNKQGADVLKAYYFNNISNQLSYDDIAFQKKHTFLENYMSGEWDNLTLLIKQAGIIKGQAFDTNRLRQALGVLLASFTVYRLYPDSLPFDEPSTRLINIAVNNALLREPDYAGELDILKSIFEQQNDGSDDKRLHVIRRLMQFTGPLAAKGVEDTTFYIYNPLISHNEVGDCPVQLGITVDEFHSKMNSRQRYNPYSLSATSTHDTKRGEDARMRINVLSELPEEWIQQINDWRMLNAVFRTQVNAQEVPTLNEEYFIYQSLIGSFPINGEVDERFIQRTKHFVLKALHEAKEHTTYELPNKKYEDACLYFVESILRSKVFLQLLIPFLNKILVAAKTYSIAQVIIKITAPGIPDIYQGAELWDVSYVDPDNRSNVDFKVREQLLAHINGRQAQPGFFPWLEEHRNSGAQKMFAIQQACYYRAQHAALFLEGAYMPVTIQNGKSDAVAYTRMYKNRWVLIVIPLNIIRHYQENENVAFFWEKLWLELPEAAPLRWYNIFTGAKITATHGVLNLGEVFATFPVAVLEGI